MGKAKPAAVIDNKRLLIACKAIIKATKIAGIEQVAPGQRQATREQKAVQSFRNATDTIGTIVPKYSMFGITRGQFSMIDIILSCLDQAGPSRVTLWTWCIAAYEIQCFERLMIDTRITSALLVIDSRARTRDRELLMKWQARHGDESIRWVINHAKLATIESATFKLLIRGSMNLNYNPRFEQFDIDEGHPGFQVCRDIENSLPMLKFETSQAEAAAASQLRQAWSESAMKPFQTLKTWAK